MPVRFWHHREFGSDGDRRNLRMVLWSEVATNYSASARAGMASLVDGFTPGEGRSLG